MLSIASIPNAVLVVRQATPLAVEQLATLPYTYEYIITSFSSSPRSFFPPGF
jgi:hypothetical protein